MKALRKRKEFLDILVKDFKRSLLKNSIWQLRFKMIDKGLCPRCGTKTRVWSGNRGAFPCWGCDFNITPREIEKLEDEPWILSRRLKQWPRKNKNPANIK